MSSSADSILTPIFNSHDSVPLTPLQTGTVYGPIHSRRLGNSLGINPLPTAYKFCDFDCVYCQYGWTPSKGTGEKIKRAVELLAEIESAFKMHLKLGTKIDCITIAGNGEPTIHPDFLSFVKGLIELRNQYYPGVKIGVLSDASHAAQPEINDALQLLDERYMKLDAGTPEKVALINKPRGNFNFQEMLNALKSMKDVVIQSLFLQGSYDNTTEEDLLAWIRAIAYIHPLEVQVYTIDRGSPAKGLQKISPEQLSDIAKRCQNKTGISCLVYE